MYIHTVLPDPFESKTKDAERNHAQQQCSCSARTGFSLPIWSVQAQVRQAHKISISLVERLKYKDLHCIWAEAGGGGGGRGLI